MSWPTDPARRAIAVERHRAAQQRRRQRPEDREHARQNAIRQFSDPAARQKISEGKKKSFQEHPEIRQRISAALKGRKRPLRRIELIRKLHKEKLCRS